MSLKIHGGKKSQSSASFKLTPLASRFPLWNKVQRLPLFVWTGPVISNARVLFVDVHYSLILNDSRKWERESISDRIERDIRHSIVRLHLPPHEFAI